MLDSPHKVACDSKFFPQRWGCRCGPRSPNRTNEKRLAANRCRGADRNAARTSRPRHPSVRYRKHRLPTHLPLGIRRLPGSRIPAAGMAAAVLCGPLHRRHQSGVRGLAKPLAAWLWLSLGSHLSSADAICSACRLPAARGYGSRRFADRMDRRSLVPCHVAHFRLDVHVPA